MDDLHAKTQNMDVQIKTSDGEAPNLISEFEISDFQILSLDQCFQFELLTSWEQ